MRRACIDKVEKLITDKTKLVAVAQVSNVLGRVNPIREIADMAHRVGAVLVWLVIELVMTVRKTRKTVDDLQRQVVLFLLDLNQGPSD